MSLTCVDLQPQKCGAKCFSLSVGAERHGSAAAEGLVQQEIQSAEIGELEPLDFPFHPVGEKCFHALGGYFAHEHGLVVGGVNDDADGAGVALVAGAGMRDL